MKLTTVLVAGALLALSASPLVFAQQTPAPAATPQQTQAHQIRKDNRNIRQNKKAARQDQRKVNKDVAQGKLKKAQAQEKNMHKAKHNIRTAKANRKQVRQQQTNGGNGPG